MVFQVVLCYNLRLVAVSRMFCNKICPGPVAQNVHVYMVANLVNNEIKYWVYII